MQQLPPAFQLLKLPELEEPDEAENNEEEFLAMTQILFGGEILCDCFFLSCPFLTELRLVIQGHQLVLDLPQNRILYIS